MAIEAAKKVQGKIPPDALEGTPSFETFYVTPYFALTRFGKWDEIPALPKPDEKLAYTRGMWHYARGIAFARRRDFTGAEKELGALQDIAGSEIRPLVMLQSAPSLVLAVATECLAGELASERGDYEKAIAHLERGVRLQDGMIYNEPPDWHYPVRQSLGAVLLEMNRPEEAATVYWEDLRRNPETGWSLCGLVQAYEAKKNDAMAAEVKKRFQRAWANADVELRSSRF
jgi:tetratricopeptide (TPR) repeat protein